jgi:DNA-binding NarL/FixJ family response regulator
VTPRIKPVIPYGVAPDIYLTEALSPRELEVLRLMAEGYHWRQMGDRLGISCRTAQTHCWQICTKLGARNRVQAVHIAHQLGYLQHTEPHTAREAVALAAYYAALANVLLQREDTP